jgi:3-hydroxybutyryl-CoA dehydrogenase
MTSVVIVGNGIMGKGISRLLTQKKVAHSVIGGRDFIANPAEFEFLVNSADLLLECLTEDEVIKIQLLKACSIINYTGIVGTCTSSLSINSLQKLAPQPHNFLGIHFMNPPTVVEAVEVVSGELTSSVTREGVIDWVKSIGSNPIEIEDSPGFLVNSILFVMLNQAAKFYSSSGLSAGVIDSAIKSVCGHKLGPLATLDLIGIDISLKILEHLHSREPESFPEPATVLYQLSESGFFGRKSGQGFFPYQLNNSRERRGDMRRG